MRFESYSTMDALFLRISYTFSVTLHKINFTCMDFYPAQKKDSKIVLKVQKMF